MPFRFDATLKEIYQERPADLADVLQLPKHLPARPLNVDLSTLSAATDIALGYGEPLEQVVDINFQSGSDAGLAGRLHMYNAVLHHHEQVPVRSIVILLRPEADHPHLTGELQYQVGQSRVQFQYEVVRLWQQPVESFLHGGLALLPLAPLCRLPTGVDATIALAAIVQEMDRRLRAEASPADAAKLLTASFVLGGLRLDRTTLDQIFRGVGVMKESAGYQIIFEEGEKAGEKRGELRGELKGELKQTRKLLLRQGRIRFGAPDVATEATIMSCNDLDRLDRLMDNVLVVNTWSELLAIS